MGWCGWLYIWQLPKLGYEIGFWVGLIFNLGLSSNQFGFYEEIKKFGLRLVKWAKCF